VVDPLYVGAFESALAVRPFAPTVHSEIFIARPRLRRLSAAAAAFATASRDHVADFQRRSSLSDSR
jgi:hypothetical protein